MNVRACYVMATICLQMLFVTGCGNHPDAENIVNNAVTAVRCENIVSNGWLIHRVSEIWKDESEGHFALLKKGSIINQDIPLGKEENAGQESLLIHYKNDAIKERFSQVMLIQNGRLPALGGMLASELKEKFMREKKDAQRKAQ